MKRTFLLIAAICLCCAPRATAQTYVQDTYSASANSFSSITVTAGNTLIALLDCRASTCPNAVVSDSQSNTWTGNLLTGGNNCTAILNSGGPVQVFAAYNVHGGATAVTAVTGGNNFEGFVAEYSGLLSSSAFDQYACQQQVNQNPESSGNSPSTTQSKELIIGLDGNASFTPTAGTGFVRRDTGVGNLNDAFEDKTVTSAGVQAATFGSNGASTAGVTVVTFKAALAANTGGQIISGPLLPQVVPSGSYPPDTGYTITPLTSGSNLQTAVNAMACGTKLNLAHNGTFTTASPWTLPANSCACHTDPTKYLIIQGDQFEANYTAGVRTDPSAQYSQYPHLSSSDGNYTFQITANGSSCWGFAGLDVTETTNGANAIFSLGDGSFSVANYPHDLNLWGNYIHGLPTSGITRCIMRNATFVAIIDNYISDCHKAGQDSQGTIGWDGLGQWLDQNNFIEGGASDWGTGGADPQSGVLMADITIRNNHFFKPLSWRQIDPTYVGIHWTVKEILELKGLQRFLMTGNVFENVWTDGQNGVSFGWKASNTSNTDPQNTVQDGNFFYNIVRHAASVFTMADDSRSGGFNNNQPVHRIYLHDNLYWDIDQLKFASQAGGGQQGILIGNIPAGAVFAPYDIWRNHETFAVGAGGLNSTVNFGGTQNVTLSYGLQLTNSIVPRPAFLGAGLGGDSILAAFAPNLVANNDCMYGGADGFTYNNATFNGKQFPANQAAVFVNPGVDFHVSGTSVCSAAASDGLDMGANINAINTATAGVTEALTNPTTVTNVSPSTFTHAGGTSITITGTNFVVGISNGGESGLGVIIGGAGPNAAISTDNCSVNTCTVVMSGAISLQVNDTVAITGTSPNAGTNMFGSFIVASVTDTTHFTYTNTGIGTQTTTGGTANRVTPGNACTSVSVTNSTTITCTTPAASGTVTTGPVSVFVSQFGIPVQSTVFGNYN